MNRYLLITRSGVAYAVSANYSHDAIAKVEQFARERVSCWFIGEAMPRNADGRESVRLESRSRGCSRQRGSLLSLGRHQLRCLPYSFSLSNLL